MSWPLRLKENYSDVNPRRVWWVRQADANRKIRVLKEKLKLAESFIPDDWHQWYEDELAELNKKARYE